jgi:hypothetical protein
MIAFGNAFDAFDRENHVWGQGSPFSSWTLPQLQAFTDWFIELYSGDDEKLALALLTMSKERIPPVKLAHRSESTRNAIFSWWPLQYNETNVSTWIPHVSDMHLYAFLTQKMGRSFLTCEAKQSLPQCIINGSERVAVYMTSFTRFEIGEDPSLKSGCSVTHERFEAYYEWWGRPWTMDGQRVGALLPAPLLHGVKVLSIHFKGDSKSLICSRPICDGLRWWAAWRSRNNHDDEHLGRHMLLAVADCCPRN